MAYKDENQQRDYQRRWIQGRRADFIASQGACAKCQSKDGLGVAYKWGRRLKRRVRSIFGLKDPKRTKLLQERCEVLCPACMKKRNSRRISIALKGRRPKNAKLSDDQVKELILWRANGISMQKTAAFFQVDKSTIQQIERGRSYRHVTEEMKKAQ